MPLKTPHTEPTDWDEIEIAFRIGEQTIEEIASEYDTSITAIEGRALAGNWYAGWEAEAIHPKYILFVNEYMGNGWDRKAALAAAGIVGCTAWSLFNNPLVARLIKQRMKAAAVRANICQDDILAAWLKIAQVDIRDFYDAKGNLKDIADLSAECAFAIASIKVTEGQAQDGSTVTYDVKDIKLCDRLAALRDIAKHLGMFVEKHEVTGKDGEALIPKEISENEAARRVAFLLTQAAQPKKE
jgi:phage terminase small subunit